MKRYILRAIFVQCVVEMLSCQTIHAAALPAGILTAQQTETASVAGIVMGFFVFLVVCFGLMFYLLLQVAYKVNELSSILKRTKL